MNKFRTGQRLREGFNTAGNISVNADIASIRENILSIEEDISTVQEDISDIDDVLSSGSLGIIETTYEDLRARVYHQAPFEDGLVPGALYSFQHNSSHWLVDSDGQYVAQRVYPDAITATITPDAVGDNPVTYYYAIIPIAIGAKIGTASAEFSVIQGDSTTTLVISGTMPAWAGVYRVYRGTVSETYTHVATVTELPTDIFAEFIAVDGESEYSYVNSLPRLWTPGELVVMEEKLETLIVRAISDTYLSPIAHSLEFPTDIIYYAIDTADSHYWDGEDYVQNFSGCIFRRIDPISNIDTDFDFRGIINAWFTIQQLPWNDTTVYNAGDLISYSNNTIYKCILEADGIEPTVTADWGNYWVALIENDPNLFIQTDPASTINCGGTTIPCVYDDIYLARNILASGVGSRNVNIHLGDWPYIALLDFALNVNISACSGLVAMGTLTDANISCNSSVALLKDTTNLNVFSNEDVILNHSNTGITVPVNAPPLSLYDYTSVSIAETSLIWFVAYTGVTAVFRQMAIDASDDTIDVLTDKYNSPVS